MFTLPKKEKEAIFLSNQNSKLLPQNILPLIQPFCWGGKEHNLKRSLCYLPRQEGTPWLSFIFDTGLDVHAYANEALLGTWGLTAGELETIALQNLCDIPAEWQATKLSRNEAKPVQALLCHSEGFTAERILDSHLLQQAHRLLQDDQLVALIPSRSMLVVMPLSGDLPFRVAEGFYSNSNDALSDWVFCISGGHVTGRVVLENEQLIVDAVKI